MWRLALLFLLLPSLASALSVQVNWDYQAGSTPAAGFRIYRQEGGCDGLGSKIADVNSSSARQYLDTTVEYGKSYCWTVVAVDSQGNESGQRAVFGLQTPFALTGPSNAHGTIIP